MNALVGIDDEGRYLSALRLFARLEFDNPNVELVHVQDFSETRTTIPIEEPVLPGRIERLLNRAESEAASLGLRATCARVTGDVGTALMLRAAETHTDMIVIGPGSRPRYGALHLGSVGRGLIIRARETVLIAKQFNDGQGKLTAVLATDGSRFAVETLESFCQMSPKGLGRILVISATETIDVNFRTAATEHVAYLVDQLRRLGAEAEGRVVEGDPVKVIDEAMAEIDADILILGSQGHGAMNSVLIGSTALQAAAGRPHAVLLMRRRC